ncbi:MAG TPA: YbaK/EbsC family protein [Thermoanaerobaculia bacterium]|nr:YbaK/EbsC family protein [Thermoanaerobaculia bacterium]
MPMTADRSILHPRVAEALERLGIDGEPLPCRPEWADTAEFCANYGIPPEEACNTILVALKKTPREYAACLVRADTRLDVNHGVAREVGFKRLSFAGAEETAALSGMEMGGVTLIGLPAGVTLLIDRQVMERPSVIIGGGNRTSKIRLRPDELLKLPEARVAGVSFRP